MTAPAATDRLLLASEVAERTRIPEGTLAYWRSIKKPDGPYWFKLGHRVVYPEARLVEWLAQQEQATALGRPA